MKRVFSHGSVPGNPFVEFAPPSNVSHVEAISHDAHCCDENVEEGELASGDDEGLLCLSGSLGWGGRLFDVKACRRAENIKGGRPFKTLVCAVQ